MNNIVEIKNLNKSFKNKHVLKDISFNIKENSIFGFIGKNGAGKTTTMKTILGLLEIDSGEIKVCNELVAFGQNKTNKYIGYLPDVPEFYGYMTAREYMYLCGECLELNKEIIEQRTNKLLSLVGLSDVKQYIKGYSRGMKQRLGIAQSLLGQPKLLICDEPTSALDPIGRKEILDILLTIKDETTVIFSTHILSDVEKICTDVVVIDDGKIVLNSSVEDIKKVTTKDEFVIEVHNKEDIYLFTNNFKNIVKIENNCIYFNNQNITIKEVLSFINSNNIDIDRFEKLEPTLESLLMEVIK